MHFSTKVIESKDGCQALVETQFRRQASRSFSRRKHVSPNVVAALEALVRFQPEEAVTGIQNGLRKRPIREEHLYLIGLCQQVDLSNLDAEQTNTLTEQVTSVVNEVLDIEGPNQWQSHLIVEGNVGSYQSFAMQGF